MQISITRIWEHLDRRILVLKYLWKFMERLNWNNAKKTIPIQIKHRSRGFTGQLILNKTLESQIN